MQDIVLLALLEVVKIDADCTSRRLVVLLHHLSFSVQIKVDYTSSLKRQQQMLDANQV